MKKVLGILLVFCICILMLTVATIPAMLWLDNWLAIIGSIICFLILVLVQVFFFGHILSKILDALIKQANEPSQSK